MTHTKLLTCRFCLQSDSELLSDINKVDAEINVLMILNNFNFNVDIDDSLPSLICRDCIVTIKKIYDFKQRYIEVQRQLRINLASLSDPLMPDPLTCNYSVKEKPKYAETNLNFNQQTIGVSMPSDQISKKYKKITSQKHQCEVCGQIYQFKEKLQKHMFIHTALKPIKQVRKCEICNKDFSRTENLKIHLRIHFGIKPYICEMCGKAFRKQQDLVRHIKIHSDVRNYVCAQCHRTFKRSGDLVIHMRTHTGDRPFSCKECPKSYTSHGGLKKHLIKIHQSSSKKNTQ